MSKNHGLSAYFPSNQWQPSEPPSASAKQRRQSPWRRHWPWPVSVWYAFKCPYPCVQIYIHIIKICKCSTILYLYILQYTLWYYDMHVLYSTICLRTAYCQPPFLRNISYYQLSHWSFPGWGRPPGQKHLQNLRCFGHQLLDEKIYGCRNVAFDPQNWPNWP